MSILDIRKINYTDAASISLSSLPAPSEGYLEARTYTITNAMNNGDVATFSVFRQGQASVIGFLTEIRTAAGGKMTGADQQFVWDNDAKTLTLTITAAGGAIAAGSKLDVLFICEHA